MLSYSQRDERWRSIEIGDSHQTLGRVGCLISCIADIASYFDELLTPADVARRCRFTVDARMLWVSCKFSKFQFTRRQFGHDVDAEVAAMRDPDQAVIFEVQDGAHWVVPVRWSLTHNTWTIKDPWTGAETLLTQYGGVCTGAAYFSRILPVVN